MEGLERLMRVLLTGSDGYLGSLAGPALSDAGHEVTGLDTGFFRAGWLYTPPVRQIPVISRDLRTISHDDLDGFDAIVHMAELSNDPMGQLDPNLTHEINHQSTMRMVGIAKEVGISRFIYMSSCSVYGVATGADVTEEASFNPQTAYAECKMLVERDLAPLANDNFHPTFLRNSTAFGASPRMRMDIVLNNLCGHAKVNGEIRMQSDGTPWRPLVHGLDIAKAIQCVLAADPGVVHNKAFNVGSNEQNYPVKEIAEIVAGVFPGCELSFGDSTGDNRSYRVNFDKISTQLPGFSCDWNAERGSQQIASLVAASDCNQEDFNGRRYIRIKQVQKLNDTAKDAAKLFWNPPADRVPA